MRSVIPGLATTTTAPDRSRETDVIVTDPAETTETTVTANIRAPHRTSHVRIVVVNIIQRASPPEQHGERNATTARDQTTLRASAD